MWEYCKRGSDELRKHGIHFYFIGLIILTLGIAFAIQSRLGTSPFDSLLVGLYRTFGLSIGSWEVVVGFSMIMANAAAERKRPEYFALITSLVTGIGIDSWLFIIGDVVIPDTWIGQTICLILSIILTGLGVAIYLQSIVAPNPMDRSMIIVGKLTGWSMTTSRAAISIVLVIIAFFFHGAIGIGTLVNAIAVGMVIQFLIPPFERIRVKSLAKLRLHSDE